MPVIAGKSVATVALVGNPNTGKSTLFTALVGVRQRIGNYPGVTVEKKIGHFHSAGRRLAVVDLPGTYSLAPRSPDEMIAVDVLLSRRDDMSACDAVICIVDASNLERNLYLVSQVLELGLPTVLALNMIDLARDRGLTIDVAALERRLGIPVVPLQANKGVGIDELKKKLTDVFERPARETQSPFPDVFRDEVSRLADVLDSPTAMPRYLVERLLLDTGGYLEQSGIVDFNGHLNGRLHEHLQAARSRLAAAGCAAPGVEAMARYQWAERMMDGVCSRSTRHVDTLSDRIDRVLTHRVWGTFAFAAVMFALFSSIFVAAAPLMDRLGAGVQVLGQAIEAAMSAGALRSLLVEGIVGGVGSVVVFLPQILILFMFIAVLEDCGYMTRAAYLMDKLMVRVGLSGKSFIPMLSSFACAIPGIMATRVIENRRDRMTTIMVAPLMSCSARLPVYTLLIGAFIPGRRMWGVLSLQGLTLFCMYLVGIVAAAVVALLLKRTVLRGAAPPFVMELPPYKFPSPKLVLHRMLERGWAFVRRAGTLIVAVAILVWALLYYPHDEASIAQDLADQRAALSAQVERLPTGDSQRVLLEHELARFEDPALHDQLLKGAQQRQSYLGRLGHVIEPVVRPLGWDWRVGSAVLASFPAREVVLGTLGVIFNAGDADLDADDGQTELQTQLRSATWGSATRDGATWDGGRRTLFTLPMALGLMVFFALCAQCAATLIIIRRETNSWRWPAFTFVYMTVLAYVGALVTYQLGTWISKTVG